MDKEKYIYSIDLNLEKINNTLNFLNTQIKKPFFVPKGYTCIQGWHNTVESYEHYKKQEIENEYLDHMKNHYLSMLLSDLYDYCYSSILLYKKGQICASISLTRKPFDDTLNYIEWIYINHREVIKLIFEGDPKEYIIKDGYKIKSEKRENIYSKIVDKEKDDIVKLFVKEIYEQRYNPKINYSMRGVWDYSIHVVTLNNNYKTHNHHLNMITFDSGYIKTIEEFYIRHFDYLLKYTIWILKRIISPNINKDDISEFNLEYLSSKEIFNGYQQHLEDESKNISKKE